MYEGKPILKKINKKSVNNPTLSSFGMRGIFYEPAPPPLVRDELRYDVGFKDSLQKTMEQEQFYRKAHTSPQKEYQSQQPPPVSNYEPLRMRYKNDVIGKVTEINMNAINQPNFKGSCKSSVNAAAIRTKQFHGYDIIKNF